MAPNNTDDSFYLNYKDGFFISLFGIMIGLYLTAMTGALCNICLVYITIKHRSLRNPCNYLLAFTAIGDLLHQLSYHVTLYYTVIGTNFTDLLPCFYAQSYAVVGIAMSFTSMFLLALDRLISILFPLWYRRTNSRVYVLMMCLASASFSAYLFYVALIFALENPKQQVICLYSSCFLNQVGRAMFQSCIFFNTLTVFCYLIIWILLVKMKTSHELKETKRIFKSLFLIMCTVVIGWMVNGLLELSLPYFYLSGAQMFFITRLGALFINIASGINLPVLYFFCTDYTVVIKKEMRKWSNFGRQSSWQSSVMTVDRKTSYKASQGQNSNF